MIRPVVIANVLVEKCNKYLLVQEETDKVYRGVKTGGKGLWTIPHGKVDFGETVEEAAAREFLEETGGKTKLIRLGVIAYARVDKTVGLLSFIYLGEGFSAVQKRREDEIGEVGWFTKKEIRELEKDGQIRDQVPLIRIIEEIEKGSEASMIEWKQPKLVREVLRRMNAEI